MNPINSVTGPLSRTAGPHSYAQHFLLVTAVILGRRYSGMALREE